MNIRKMLWTFFYLFLVVDGILLYQWFSVSDMSADPASAKNIQQEIRMDGIKFGSLDAHVPSGAYYSGNDGGRYLAKQRKRISNDWQVSVKGQKLRAVPKKPVDLGTSRATARKKLESILADDKQIIAGNEYVFDPELSQSDDDSGLHVIVFAQKLDHETFVSTRGQIQFTFDDYYNLKSYTQTYVTNVQRLSDVPAVLSQRSAFLNAYQFNEIANNSVLNWSKLGYATLIDVRGETIYIPIWVFSLTNAAGETNQVQINALNGSLMKD
ncbi:two-component system regulatory protein YycI [Weissella ceti]|uniref:two-component system regulatory protein YycI n=1 Tax=Weissella ceti TaxID=759620 RepID=UPI001BCACEED|nr:two-component system regulatory protein YycI [Weissella ceti]QVK12158.1 two-component system regulatory protein YycI [Weissella ceti]